MTQTRWSFVRHGWAALATWALVSSLVLYLLWTADGSLRERLLPTVLLQVLYVVAMVYSCRQPGSARHPRLRQVALWVQAAAALALGWLLPIGFLPIYTIIWMAILPHFVSARVCHVSLALIMLAWYVVARWGWQADDALVNTLLFATFHYFALLSASEARRAEAARLDAETLNRELLATQHLLAEATRHGERTRIARDLHDLLGHHLTALTINLQVAERVTTGEAKARVQTCHALSRQMLDDVRAAVSTLRDESAVDFTRALRLIVDNIPQLRIHLDIKDDLRVDDVQVAESLLRCVQEAITNTLRHADASECFVKVWRADGRLHLRVTDNGRAPADWQSGNGLLGMRERVERMHGKLTVERVRSALQIRIQIPLTA